MKFLLDEQIPPQAAIALAALGLPFTHVITEKLRGTKDVDLYKVLKERDWHLITEDRAMRRKPHERQAMLDNGAGVYIFTGTRQKPAILVTRLLLEIWDELEADAHDRKRPFCVQITDQLSIKSF